LGQRSLKDFIGVQEGVPFRKSEEGTHSGVTPSLEMFRAKASTFRLSFPFSPRATLSLGPDWGFRR
jgi:hypothetical protein